MDLSESIKLHSNVLRLMPKKLSLEYWPTKLHDFPRIGPRDYDKVSKGYKLGLLVWGLHGISGICLYFILWKYMCYKISKEKKPPNKSNLAYYKSWIFFFTGLSTLAGLTGVMGIFFAHLPLNLASFVQSFSHFVETFENEITLLSSLWDEKNVTAYISDIYRAPTETFPSFDQLNIVMNVTTMKVTKYIHQARDIIAFLDETRNYLKTFVTQERLYIFGETCFWLLVLVLPLILTHNVAHRPKSYAHLWPYVRRAKILQTLILILMAIAWLLSSIILICSIAFADFCHKHDGKSSIKWDLFKEHKYVKEYSYYTNCVGKSPFDPETVAEMRSGVIRAVNVYDDYNVPPKYLADMEVLLTNSKSLYAMASFLLSCKTSERIHLYIFSVLCNKSLAGLMFQGIFCVLVGMSLTWIAIANCYLRHAQCTLFTMDIKALTAKESDSDIDNTQKRSENNNDEKTTLEQPQIKDDSEIKINELRKNNKDDSEMKDGDLKSRINKSQKKTKNAQKGLKRGKSDQKVRKTQKKHEDSKVKDIDSELKIEQNQDKSEKAQKNLKHQKVPKISRSQKKTKKAEKNLKRGNSDENTIKINESPIKRKENTELKDVDSELKINKAQKNTKKAQKNLTRGKSDQNVPKTKLKEKQKFKEVDSELGLSKSHRKTKTKVVAKIIKSDKNIRVPKKFKRGPTVGS